MIRCALILLLMVACLLPAGCHPFSGAKSRRETIDLSGAGWMLWRDKDAAWENDKLFLPPVDLAKVPTNAPTKGWEILTSKEALPVTVPGTAEEYLGKGQGPESMVKGVTWWTRAFKVPDDARGQTIRLLFDSVRLRAEVYVNGKLVAYDMVGGTPFEANLTGVVKPGEKVQLAVRITNPGGNFDWCDNHSFKWGKYSIPMGHGFGGVTGGVHLVVSNPVYLDDLSIQNTPIKTAVNVMATIKNTTTSRVAGSAEVLLKEKSTGRVIFRKEFSGLDFKPGETSITWPLSSLPDVKLWDLETPNLYVASVVLKPESGRKDEESRVFGFRWFAPEGIGSDAILRLNGKRIVLRTAISWGFWPINGIFPSPELAAKQIQIAKDYGLNMLNFHRCIGNPIVFDKADEMGLLYFEEPGGYVSGEKDPFAQALCREKLFRMVKRDRSHPSLIIYNMINEQWTKFGADVDPAVFAVHRQDLQDAHAIDPSRVMVYTSAWAGRSADPDNDKAKMNMQPFDAKVHMNGWWDYHRASGPEVWKQEFYQGPDNHYGRTENIKEVVYWGEEGALSAPPRLGLIEKSLEGVSNLGWDGAVYRDWYKAFDDYLTTNKLRTAFPNVDDLCKAMGVVSLEHQGRKIEDTRICNANDGYAINGWESELIDNHSGVVDEFRNPKADPAILAYYNQPLYVAVKPRRQITSFPGAVTVDFYLLNEKNLNGEFTLRIRLSGSDGKEIPFKDLPVTVKGGDVYGQSLAEGLEIPLNRVEGMTTITATLLDAQGAEKASGHDQVFSVNWKKIPIAGKGAVLESGSRIRDFLKNEKGIDVPLFDGTQPKLDWLIVAKSPVNELVAIPKEAFLQPDGKSAGIQESFYDGENFNKALYQKTESALDLKIATGATPDPHVPMTENYSMRWNGMLMPPASGEYTIRFNARDGVRCWLNGKQLLDVSKDGKEQVKEFKVTLTAGKPVPFRAELLQKRLSTKVQMLWLAPIHETVTPAQVLERARRDGTTVLILDRATAWLRPVCLETGIPQGKTFQLGISWLGGQYFVKDHPLFAGLPVNQALNWPYQSVVGGNRMAMEISGGELVVGAYHSWPMELGSALSILPDGHGRIILSTLDLIDQLDSPNSAAEVVRRLFCNFLSDAAPKK